MTEVKENGAVEKIQLSLSGLLADLKNGLDRKAIAAKYGLPKLQITNIFKHPALAGQRVHRPKASTPKFELIEDVDFEVKAPKAKKVAVVTENTAIEEEAPQAENAVNGDAAGW